MTIAVFPQSIVTWLDRIDELDTVFAQDPNSIAAEVGAIETVLGVLPQVEKNPVIGNTTTYNTVDDRLSDMVAGSHIPVLSMSSPQQLIGNWQSAGNNYGQWNTYVPNYDPFNMYNGQDVTIPANGWWHVTAAQTWDWWSTGYHGMWFWIDGSYFRHDHWFWDFPGNIEGSYWYRSVAEQRPATTYIDWQGVLKAGQRLRILSENGCPHSPHRATNMNVALSFVRSVASNVPSSATTGTTTPTIVGTQPNI